MSGSFLVSCNDAVMRGYIVRRTRKIWGINGGGNFREIVSIVCIELKTSVRPNRYSVILLSAATTRVFSFASPFVHLLLLLLPSFSLSPRDSRRNNSALPISRPIFLFKLLSCSWLFVPALTHTLTRPRGILCPCSLSPAPRTPLLPSLAADRSISPSRRRGRGKREWNEFDRPPSSRAIPPSNEVEFRF